MVRIGTRPVRGKGFSLARLPAYVLLKVGYGRCSSEDDPDPDGTQNINGAERGTRTPTTLSGPRILSPIFAVLHRDAQRHLSTAN